MGQSTATSPVIDVEGIVKPIKVRRRSSASSFSAHMILDLQGFSSISLDAIIFIVDQCFLAVDLKFPKQSASPLHLVSCFSTLCILEAAVALRVDFYVASQFCIPLSFPYLTSFLSLPAFF